MARNRRSAGFTLIELLVVIAVIAVLIGILLPALGQSRDTARAVRCAVQMREVATGVIQYVGQFGFYPPSYVYGANPTGFEWREADQLQFNPNPENGYIHWSYSLFMNGAVPQNAFTCPAIPTRGGAPRSNPGGNPDDWEEGQIDDMGNTGPTTTSVEDRQVSRLAFTGNAAIFPRNKFTNVAGRPRRNVLVRDAMLRNTSGTILLTEFHYNQNWNSLRAVGGDEGVSDPEAPVIGGVIKSHRPVTPFVGFDSTDPFRVGIGSGAFPRFAYPDPETRLQQFTRRFEQIFSAISNSQTSLNAVGRHHPGRDINGGGTTNFAFADGHVKQGSLTESILQRQWGTRFYSISGSQEVWTGGFAR